MVTVRHIRAARGYTLHNTADRGYGSTPARGRQRRMWRTAECTHDPAHPHPFAGPQRHDLHPDRRRGRRAAAAVQSAAARGLDVSGADLSHRAVWQVRLLRHIGAVDRPDLGLLRHSLARPWRLL